MPMFVAGDCRADNTPLPVFAFLILSGFTHAPLYVKLKGFNSDSEISSSAINVKQPT